MRKALALEVQAAGQVAPGQRLQAPQQVAPPEPLEVLQGARRVAPLDLVRLLLQALVPLRAHRAEPVARGVPALQVVKVPQQVEQALGPSTSGLTTGARGSPATTRQR